MITVLAGGHGRGFVDGTGAAARFEEISAVALDGDGNVYAADAANHAIRKITPQGVVTTLAGGTSGFEDGQGAAASSTARRALRSMPTATCSCLIPKTMPFAGSPRAGWSAPL